ncbi:MAG: glycoside hydrolase family 25 protein [Oscillospiraceae bacterium]|nr:glycoside hydrolase family 25 protein [Oscillospiraceae bacterium]
MKKKWILPVFALLLGAALLAVYIGEKTGLGPSAVPRNERKRNDFSVDEKGRASYPGALLGIDVSDYQGAVDWKRVHADGVDFAILRIGYRGYSLGNLKLDESFSGNYVAAKQAGLKLGVYFYSQATSPEEARQEAEWVLKMLDGIQLELPVFFDWEKAEQGRTEDKLTPAVSDYAAEFCRTISEGGYKAGVYFNQEYGYTVMRLRRLTDYAFWLAEYQSYQSFPFQTAFWQFSSDGRVDGIETPVDLDLMYAVENVNDETETNPG